MYLNKKNNLFINIDIFFVLLLGEVVNCYIYNYEDFFFCLWNLLIVDSGMIDVIVKW